MKNRIQTLSFLATLAVVIGMISWGGTLNAQTTPSSPADQQTPQSQPSPDTPPAQQPSAQPTPSTPEPPAASAPSSTPSSQSGSSPSTQSPSPSQTPDQTTPSQSSPSTQSPSTSQPPEQSSPTSSASGAAGSDSQVFSGTVEKSGDKYVLKDDTGKTYDIDHQDDVKKFEGKRVRVQGKLDDTGKKILVK